METTRSLRSGGRLSTPETRTLTLFPFTFFSPHPSSGMFRLPPHLSATFRPPAPDVLLFWVMLFALWCVILEFRCGIY